MYQKQVQMEIDERTNELGGSDDPNSLASLMKSQTDEDRRLLKLNFNKYLNNTVSAQGQEIFKNQNHMNDINMGGEDAGG